MSTTRRDIPIRSLGTPGTRPTRASWRGSWRWRGPTRERRALERRHSGCLDRRRIWGTLRPGRAARVSLLSWRSTKVKRKVPSTLAGEAMSLSASIADVEWLQCMYRDVMFAGLRCPDWRRTMSTFGVVLRSQCTMDARQSQAHAIGSELRVARTSSPRRKGTLSRMPPVSPISRSPCTPTAGAAFLYGAGGWALSTSLNAACLRVRP